MNQQQKSAAEKLIEELSKSGETRHFDTMPPNFYINRARDFYEETTQDLISEGYIDKVHELKHRFLGTHSEDFYKGMLAGICVSGEIIDQHRMVVVVVGAVNLLQHLEGVVSSFIPDNRLDANTDLVDKKDE